MAENMAPTMRSMHSEFSISDHNNNNNNDSTFSTSSNIVPSTDHRPSKRLDLAAIARSKRHSTSPMKDRNQNSREEQNGHFDFSTIDNPMKSRLQLISPPPEEDLAYMRVAGNSHSRSNSSTTSLTPNTKKTPSKSSTNPKRKRNTQASSQISTNGESSTRMEPMEATPNPKPRKQRHVRIQSVDSPTRPTLSNAASSSKQRQVEPTTPTRSTPKNLLVQSPHVHNPEADYLPPLPALALASNPARRAVLGSRRRSATPIPHYEPPTDVFTPPRQVYINPPPKEGANRSASRAKSAATSSRRKSHSAKQTTTLRIFTGTPAVKLEMPDIDLSEPMPPPSPTDDPLLLSGPPEPPATSPARPSHREASVQVAEIPAYNPRRISPHPTILNSTPFNNSPPQPIIFANDLPPSSPEPPFDSEDAQAIDDFTSHRDVQGQFDSSDDSMMRLDDPLDANVSPVNFFNFDGPPDSGSWSDSDTETTTNFASTIESTQRKSKHASIQEGGAQEGEGEYTGRWMMMKVRTKMDPPSSATRVRMEDWGRPISPFPFPKVQRLSFLGEGEDESEETEAHAEEQDHGKSSETEEDEEEREVARLSMEPEEDIAKSPVEEHLLNEDHSMIEVEEGPEHDADISYEHEEDEQEDERQVREMSTSLSDNEDQEDEEEREVREMSMEISEGEQEDELPLVTPARIPSVPPPSRGSSHPPEPEVQAQVQIPTQQEPEPEPHPELQLLSQPPQPQPGQEMPHFLIDEDSPMGQPLNESRPHYDAAPEDGDESTDMDDDPGLVKIISSDPRAAARAAAILKQHDYECYTKLLKRKHLSKNTSQASFLFTDANDIAKDARRRDLSASGISKQRRRSTMGVLGDKVIIPGSPVKTLPELLLEAENEISFAEKSFHAHEHNHMHVTYSKNRDPFKTPLPSRSHLRPRLSHYDHSFNYDSSDGPREWTKEEWKLLDACFTDQRVFLAEHLGLDDELAPVDLVNLEDVVQRFVDLVGGQELVAGFGDAWDSESLLSRTQALQKKQKAGKVAPPTTPYVSPSQLNLPRPSAADSPEIIVESPESSNPLGGIQRLATMKVPDFTPLGRRAMKPTKKGPSKHSTPVLPEPVKNNTAPFSNLPPEQGEDRSLRRKMPSVFFAPRYSHLRDEALDVSRDLGSLTSDVNGEGDSGQSEHGMEEGASQYSEGDSSILSGLNDSAEHSGSFSSQNEDQEVASQGMAKRVKGFIYSYLGGSKPSIPAPKPRLNTRQRGLPLPPRSVLEKPRGPVVTPAKPQLTRAPAPKDLVNLHPAPLPKSSKLPTRCEPRRLVDLHPAPPPVEKSKDAEKEMLLRRRSSTSSVKDLIGGFEAMQKKAKEDEETRRKLNLRRGGEKEKDRPRWRF